MEASVAAVAPEQVSLRKTEECYFVTTHFHMGIGRMRNIRDLEVTTTADKSQLRHQKQLIDSEELDEIRSQDGFLTRHLNSLSSRYSESTRFVQYTEIPKLYKAMEAYRTIRRPKLVADFMKAYRALEAVDFKPLADVLGDQFDRGDYPNSDTVEKGFWFEFELRPVGQLDLTGLPSFIIDAEVAKERAKREQAVIEWKDNLRDAGVAVVDALFNAVKPQPDGKKRKIYETTIDNLQEYLKNFNIRDLAEDTEYQTKVVEPLKKLMKGVTVDQIRESATLKDHIAKQVAEIQKTAKVLVQVTGRKFR